MDALNAPGGEASKNMDNGDVVLIGTRRNGFQFSFAKDGLNFTKFDNDPLVFFDERD